MTDDDLACDCPSALPLLGCVLAGAALTTVWIVPVAWRVLRDPIARQVAGVPW